MNQGILTWRNSIKGLQFVGTEKVSVNERDEHICVFYRTKRLRGESLMLRLVGSFVSNNQVISIYWTKQRVIQKEFRPENKLNLFP